MASKCSICSSKNRQKIEQLYLSGTSLRKIAEQTGTKVTTLHRHFSGNHMDEKLIKAQEKKESLQADEILTEVEKLKNRAYTLLKQSEKEKSFFASAAFIREIRQILELFARLAGRLKEQQQMNITIMNHPQFIAIQTKILTFLDKYPEVKQAFIQELEAEEATVE